MAATQVMIDVPGSSANLGPGYDCLAIALPFRLRVGAERRPGQLSVHVSGAVSYTHLTLPTILRV